jgi:basic amino acid/polyamine antiporter, APA family
VPLVLGRGDGDPSRTGEFPPGVAPASAVLAAAALLLAGGVGLSVLTRLAGRRPSAAGAARRE